ncbi:hypothetical protein PIB30_057166 [Stylosanthes scabra]|uniref:Uncharacterized protein n=1 Tax=Stylosanthes scabra TaxID=79078 RepID=A0ABU6YK21_9FABA|nr:hypothetical protein [Stylosanthes scabra]
MSPTETYDHPPLSLPQSPLLSLSARKTWLTCESRFLSHHDMTRKLQEVEERQKAMQDELSRRLELCDPDVEALKQQMREELRLMQEARWQMGVTGEHMRAGGSSVAGDDSFSVAAAHDPPLPPPHRQHHRRTTTKTMWILRVYEFKQ